MVFIIFERSVASYAVPLTSRECSHGEEHRSRIYPSGFDHHGLAWLRPETGSVLGGAPAQIPQALRIGQPFNIALAASIIVAAPRSASSFEPPRLLPRSRPLSIGDALGKRVTGALSDRLTAWDSGRKKPSKLITEPPGIAAVVAAFGSCGKHGLLAISARFGRFLFPPWRRDHRTGISRLLGSDYSSSGPRRGRRRNHGNGLLLIADPCLWWHRASAAR